MLFLMELTGRFTIMNSLCVGMCSSMPLNKIGNHARIYPAQPLHDTCTLCSKLHLNLLPALSGNET
jgi:hypothetical protein